MSSLRLLSRFHTQLNAVPVITSINQMYVELQVPQDNSNLKDSIEEYFNMSSMIGKFCETDCQTFVQSQKRSTISSIAETEFLIVILTRAIETMGGFEFNGKQAVSTDNVILR